MDGQDESARDATGVCMVVTTARAENTRAIVDALLSRRLAACVQVNSIRSHYVWQGVLCDEAEDMLFIKARTEDYPAIETAIRGVHGYDTPEILRFDVAAGSKSYLDWIEAMTARTGG